MNTRRYGFTVIELMITLAVAATLTTIGVPALSTFIKNSGLKAEAFELLDAITFARSEAIKRKTRVILCRSADPMASTPSCGGSAYTWSSGWIVYASADANSTFNAGTDILLAINEGSSDPISIKSNTIGNNYLEYNSDGSLAETGTGRYAICDERGEAYGRQINVPLMGRPHLVKGTASIPISDCDSPS